MRAVFDNALGVKEMAKPDFCKERWFNDCRYPECSCRYGDFVKPYFERYPCTLKNIYSWWFQMREVGGVCFNWQEI